MITNLIAQAGKEIIPEYSNSEYSMVNSGGVETEVGEFLYSLIRLIKPRFILETGTYYGLSSAYMALALKANGKGHLTTLDPLDYDGEARNLWERLDLLPLVSGLKMRSLDYSPEAPIDFLFLDSEPQFRFDEFVRFFDFVVPGGFIAIHDLHPHLSHNLTPINGVLHWPFGDFRTSLGQYMKSHQIQTFAFPSPRGFILFQKCRDDFSHTKYLEGEI